MRMLRLSGLDSEGMTDDQRDAFINMAENLGIDPGEAEDMVDDYLEEIERQLAPPPPKPVVTSRRSEDSRPSRRLPRPAVATAATINPADRSGMVSKFYQRRLAPKC